MSFTVVVNLVFCMTKDRGTNTYRYACISTLYLLQLKLSKLMDRQWKVLDERTLSFNSNSLRAIKQQLWFCAGRAGIHIHNTRLQHQRTIPCRGMGFLTQIHDVAEMSSGDLVIATSNGLFHTDPTGETLTKEGEHIVHIILCPIITTLQHSSDK